MKLRTYLFRINHTHLVVNIDCMIILAIKRKWMKPLQRVTHIRDFSNIKKQEDIHQSMFTDQESCGKVM